MRVEGAQRDLPTGGDLFSLPEVLSPDGLPAPYLRSARQAHRSHFILIEADSVS